jgi:hypothetical protein
VRTALIISALAHALFWGLATLSAPHPLAKPSEPPPIVVDLVSPEELAEASAKAAAAETAAPAEKTASAEKDAAADQKPEPQAAPPRPQAPPAQAKSATPKPDTPKPDTPKSATAKSATAESATAKSATPKSATPDQPAPSAAPVAPKLPQFAAGGWLETALSLPPSTTSPFDVAESGANLEVSEIAAFKAHLQECWKPPAGLAGAGNLVVVLRVSLQSNGALAGEPSLLAASASPEGPALIQTASRALQQCQPFAFLPADKYKEWRTLDLSFSPAGLRTLPTL